MSEEKLTELLTAGYEAEDLDYKLWIDINSKKSMLGLCIDIMAMANTQGGYIVIGVNDNFEPQGLPSDFHIDQAQIQQIISNYMKPVAEITYAEKNLKIDDSRKKFAFIYVNPSKDIVVACKDGHYNVKPNKTTYAFRSGDIFVRKGTSSQRADSDSIRLLIEKRIKKESPAPRSTKISEQEIIELQLEQKHNLQRPDYKQFIGREEYVEDILEKLRQRFFVISIDGIGGVGKTALALEIAYRCLQSKLFDAIIWVSAKKKRLILTGIDDIVPSLTSYENLINSILEVLGFSTSINKPLPEKEKKVDKLLRTAKCLIIVDNLEAVEDERIFEFLKNLPEPSKALITSRKRLGEVERVVRLKEMSFEEAKKLMLMDARDKRVDSLLDADEETLRDIYNVTGGIPLAIRWVIGWISLGHSISWVCEKVKKSDSPVLDFCFKEIYEKVLSQDARKILCIMPIFGYNPSKEELKAAVALPYDKFEEAIAQLVMLSLINRDIKIDNQGISRTYYNILPLTLSFAQSKLSEKRGLEVEARKRLARYLQRQQKQREALEQYGYALERIGATTEKGKLAALQSQLAFAAYQRGNYAEAVKLFKQALKVDPNLAYTYQLWAMVERQEGNIGKAEELFREASRLNPANPIIWRSWAMMKKELGNLEESQKILRQGLQHRPDDKATIHSLAVIQSIKGRFEEADRLFQKAYTERPKKFGDKRNNMYVYAARAENLRKWGESEERKKLFRSAREKYMKGLVLISKGLYFNPTEWNLIKNRIRLYRSLARVESKMGNFSKAEELFKKAIYYSPKNLGQRKHNSAVYYSRALNFTKMNKINEAIRMCNESNRQAHNEKALQLKYQLISKLQKGG